MIFLQPKNSKSSRGTESRAVYDAYAQSWVFEGEEHHATTGTTTTGSSTAATPAASSTANGGGYFKVVQNGTTPKKLVGGGKEKKAPVNGGLQNSMVSMSRYMFDFY